MIVLDVNLLLYVYDGLSLKHDKARRWMEEAFSSRELVGLPWQTIAGFLRIVTNPRIYKQPRTIEEAIQAVESWLDLPNVKLLSLGDQHWPYLRRTLMEGQVRGPLVSDAQLAAITMEYGGVLHTTDRDFARFPGLRWINPLEDTKSSG